MARGAAFLGRQNQISRDFALAGVVAMNAGHFGVPGVIKSAM
jgi:hypothetical protein